MALPKKKQKKVMKLQSTYTNECAEVPFQDDDFERISEDWKEKDDFQTVRQCVVAVLEADEDHPQYFIYKLWPSQVILKRSVFNESQDDPMFMLHQFTIKEEKGVKYAELAEGEEVFPGFFRETKDGKIPDVINGIRESDLYSLDDPTVDLIAEDEHDDDNVRESHLHESSNGKDIDIQEQFGCPLSEVEIVESEDKPILRNVAVLSRKSLNGRIYPDEVMEAAIPLFEGAKAFLDHPPEGERSDARRMRDLIGKHVNVRFDRAKGQLRSDLHLIPNQLVKEVVLPIARHDPSLMGNSIAAKGKVTTKGIVEELTAARSIDLVAEPATNKGLYEAIEGFTNKDKNKGGETMEFADVLKDEKLMKQLREHVQGEMAEDEELKALKENVENTLKENKNLKDEIAALKANETKVQEAKEITDLISASKLPDKVKAKPETRTVLEAVAKDQRKTILESMEATFAEIGNGGGRRSDPPFNPGKDHDRMAGNSQYADVNEAATQDMFESLSH